ncbi:hypothetical protein Kfla_4045 [Kribbella flavida DSM 17836]|uniref:Uncharacterized protein n=1 Tax=Kribbella flavida (strain DSM 17836 / JCM 10339 / NBRC 14399) TaxID=479435 RepID=D2PSF6_KRIFD|nr:hypothetical protein [Kribbella flavida]ADB33094.1 hypothetical protein Kfla_4045 [Kribbella flavida DSM 17836]
MNEEELNEALRDVIVRSSPPPSMDPARALGHARRARRRRRMAWAGVTVVTLAVGVGVAPAVANHLGDQGVASGTSTTQTLSSAAPTTRKSNDPWPEGQVDRTATAGPRAVRSVTLMHDLSSAVPPSFSTPDLKYPDGRPMRWPQSQYASSDGEQDYWEYMAVVPVQKDNRVGQLLVQSTTPSGKPAMDPCTFALKFWGGTGGCTMVDVDGKKVGVVTAKEGGSYDQWAAYRHDDGTVVYLAQAEKSDHPGRLPLNQPVFTTRQLAELVTSKEFKIST